MTNDNLSETEVKFIKDNFGFLKVPKELQSEFIRVIKLSLNHISEKRSISLKNWLGKTIYFGYNNENKEFIIYQYNHYNHKIIKIFSKEKWMKKFAKAILKFVKEENYKDNNKKFLEDSIKITNDISNAKIDEPLNIPVVKQSWYSKLIVVTTVVIVSCIVFAISLIKYLR